MVLVSRDSAVKTGGNPMSGHSANPSFEVVASTRRRWTAEEKEAILSETAGGAVSVSEVARRHGLSRDLLFRWRRELRKAAAATAQAQRSNHGFVPLSLPAPARLRSDAVEIVLICGRRLIVDKDIDVSALKRVIEALEQR
jgi:transposase